MPDLQFTKYNVPSVDTACKLIRRVCESDAPIAMRQINRENFGSRSTVMRIVSSLCANGFLHKNERAELVAGETMLMLTHRIQIESDLRKKVVPLLQELAQAAGETAHFAIPLESHCLIQEVVDSPELIRVASRPGTLIEYHCSAMGKAILAHRADLVENLQNEPFNSYTHNTITDVDTLTQTFAQIRTLGYAVDEEEYYKGARCIGAPVFNNQKQVVAAIGITGPISSLTQERIPEVAKLVIAATNRMAE